MSSAAPFKCDICNQNFYLESNLLQHYFCIYRNEDELEKDGTFLFDFLPSALTGVNSSDLLILREKVIHRHLPSPRELVELKNDIYSLSSKDAERRGDLLYSINKFKEWVEDIKIHLIYNKYCRKEQKSLQTIALLDSLFDIQGLDYYVFNEAFILIPEIKDDRESVARAFNLLFERSLKTAAPFASLLLLTHFGTELYEQWVEADKKTPSSMDPNLCKLGRLLMRFLSTLNIPPLVQHANPSDPHRYQKLTVKVEPFEPLDTDTSDLASSHLEKVELSSDKSSFNSNPDKTAQES